MKPEKLKRSILVIVLLIISVIVQHIIYDIFYTTNSLLSTLICMSADIPAGVLFVFFLLQLRDNLEHYLEISNINTGVLILIVSFSVLMVSLKTSEVASAEKLLPEALSMLILLFAFLSILASLSLLIIQYIRIGNRLKKFPATRQVAITFYLVPVYLFLSLFIEILHLPKLVGDLMLIIGLLPYIATFMLYRKLLKAPSEQTSH